MEPGPASESYGALSNLQSLHTLECEEDGVLGNRRHLAFIPMKNLRILKSSETEVIWALLTTDPPVQQTPTQGVVAYSSLLWRSFHAMELSSEDDLADTFIPACRTSHFHLSGITKISPYPCRFCSSFCRSASEGVENRHWEWTWCNRITWTWSASALAGHCFPTCWVPGDGSTVLPDDGRHVNWGVGRSFCWMLTKCL